MRIHRTERRQDGDTSISLAVLAFSFAVVVPALSMTAGLPDPWQASICIARGLNPDTATYDLDHPSWRSDRFANPRPAVTEMLTRLANLGPTDDTTPLVNALLPPD
jgi:hypothetical protein